MILFAFNNPFRFSAISKIIILTFSYQPQGKEKDRKQRLRYGPAKINSVLQVEKKLSSLISGSKETKAKQYL